MSKIFWIIIIVIIALIGVMLFTDNGQPSDIPDPNQPEVEVTASIKDTPEVRTADLVAVDRSDSSGKAYITRNGKLTHLVEADMPDPAAGSLYEGWLVDTSVSPVDFFSTGVMSKNQEGKWILEYEADAEYPSHNRVVITEETIIDETPEEHIIEGDF